MIIQRLSFLCRNSYYDLILKKKTYLDTAQTKKLVDSSFWHKMIVDCKVEKVYPPTVADVFTLNHAFSTPSTNSHTYMEISFWFFLPSMLEINNIIFYRSLRDSSSAKRDL